MKDINVVFLNYMMKDDILRAVESVIKDVQNCPYNAQITVADNSENKDGIKEALTERFGLVCHSERSPDDWRGEVEESLYKRERDSSTRSLKAPSVGMTNNEGIVKYVDCGGNIGFGRGNVRGFKDTPARYYFALNRDTIIPENSRTIERLVKFMDDHPKIGCIGPKLLNMDGTLQYSCYRFDLPSILIKPLKQINFDKKYNWVRKHSDRLLMKDFDHNETRPVDWVLGAAMVVRREVVEQIGWFDDRYFMYLEDCDWCHTMWEQGWPVYYVHNIIILHAHARESAKVPGIIKALWKNKLARIHFASWWRYLWKWMGKHKYAA